MPQSSLEDLSQSFTTLVEKSAPSVVRVEGRRRTPSSGIVFSADGVIVTANHALEQDEGIDVGLDDGSVLPAKLVGRDPTTDLAALRVEATSLPTLPWAELDGVKVGQLAVALGRPGRTVRASLGMVSVVGAEEWRAPAGGRLERYLSADVKLYPGFSGGPLVNSAGLALGMNTSGLLRRVSFSVPGPAVKRVVETLLAHGGIRRGFLGVATHPVALPAELAEKLGQEAALLVVAVQPGSPAQAAGIVLGDAIVAADGAAVDSPVDLLPLLEEERVGKEIALKIVRAGVLAEVRLTVGTRNGKPIG